VSIAHLSMLAAFGEKQVRIPYHGVQLATSFFPHFLEEKKNYYRGDFFLLSFLKVKY
jgi:hypothetical protein